jgi:hypothetical protein
MSLIVFDGFDHYAAQADMQARAPGPLAWNDISGASYPVVTFVPGRGGIGNAAALQASDFGPVGVGASFNANYTAGFPSIATLMVSGLVGIVDYMLMDYANQIAQLTLRCFTDSGIILAYAGDPDIGTPTTTAVLLGSSPPNAFAPYVWNKIEVSAVMGTAGSFDIHVNGNSAFSMSGVRTIAPTSQTPSPNTWFNGFKVRVQGSGVSEPFAYLDDFNLNDTTTGPGTYPCNSFLGDVATRTLKTAANSSVQWTPLANANWQEVGEVQFDADVTYNFATAVGNKDVFSFTTLPTTVSAVLGVQVTGAYRKLDASDQTILQGIVSGGTSSSGAVWHLSLGYMYTTDLFTVDPHTGATWLPSAVNALLASYTLNS